MTLQFNKTLRGRVALPASKSISNRALFINALADRPCRIDNLAVCDDTAAMLRVTNRETVPPTSHGKRDTSGMGSLFAQDDAEENVVKNELPRIDVGAAGTAMRFATALLAVSEGKEYVVCGTERMHRRPIGILVEALRSLGADITYERTEGFPPLIIKGKKLTGTTVELSADVSSQFISALLMIGPILPQGLQLRLRGDILSRPYINLTLSLMEQFGAHGMWVGDSTIYVHNGGYRRSDPLLVEADWSAASYWYELMALSQDEEAIIELTGLKAESMQGDSRVSEFFAQLGVHTARTEQGILLTKQAVDPDLFLQLDLSEQPDLAQTLVCTCAMMHVPFHFTGLQSLRIKETDRLEALQREISKFGISTKMRLEGELLWDGHVDPAQSDISVSTYEDHRMAMAFAPCAMVHPGLTIEHPEVVSKSYPGFWKDLGPYLKKD